MMEFLVVAHLAVSGWSYPAKCCSDFDCAEIATENVTPTTQGYELLLMPGDHHFIKVGMRFKIDYADVRVKDSPDGKYHLCLSKPMVLRPWSTRIICFFRPPQSS